MSDSKVSYTPPEKTGDDLLDQMSELMAYRAWVKAQNQDEYEAHMMSNHGIQLPSPYVYADSDMYWYSFDSL